MGKAPPRKKGKDKKGKGKKGKKGGEEEGGIEKPDDGVDYDKLVDDGYEPPGYSEQGPEGSILNLQSKQLPSFAGGAIAA